MSAPYDALNGSGEGVTFENISTGVDALRAEHPDALS